MERQRVASLTVGSAVLEVFYMVIGMPQGLSRSNPHRQLSHREPPHRRIIQGMKAETLPWRTLILLCWMSFWQWELRKTSWPKMQITLSPMYSQGMSQQAHPTDVAKLRLLLHPLALKVQAAQGEGPLQHHHQLVERELM